jgi:glycosyltransferase involved in cell wall biosynthesis
MKNGNNGNNGHVTPKSISLRLGLQQRVLPSYRVPFFDALAAACRDGLGVFAGPARKGEMIEAAARLEQAVYFPALNRHFLGGPLYVCWQSGFLTWLDTWHPEALVVEANPRYLHTLAAVRWMHARQRPVIGWGLGAPGTYGGTFGNLRRSARQNFLRQFDALLVYSRQGAEEYAALGIDPKRIFVAPNAMARRPQKSPPSRPLPTGPATVLFVGRLQERKRVDLLLRACAALPESLRPSLWVVGDGPSRDELESLARQVYPSAQFWGPQYGATLDPLFSQADLFVLPGTGGLAVQQAMSFGLPVIVAAGDGTQSNLVRPGNGWSVPPGDSQALETTLAAALADLPGLRRKGEESFRIVSEEVNVELMVEAFAACIRSVVKDREG